MQFKTKGKPVVLEITNSTIFDLNTVLDDRLYDPNPENIFVWRNKLNLRLKWDFLTAGVRIDQTVYANPPGPDAQGNRLYINDIRPEDLMLKFRYKRLTVSIGDDYVQLGRGMALSLRKFDELGFDLNVRGAHVQWRNRLVSVKAAVGLVNIANIDNVTGKFVPDPLDAVFAARVVVRPLNWLRIGVNGVDIERRHSPLTSSLGWLTDGDLADPNNPQQVRTWITGGTLQLSDIGEVFNLYVEANYQETASNRIAGTRVTPQTDTGLAFYTEATLYTGRFNMLFEFKHYDNWDIRSSPHPNTHRKNGILDKTFTYVVPPSLERYDQEVVNNTDVTGGHLRLDYRLPDNQNILSISSAFFYNAPLEKEWTMHTYAVWEHKNRRGDRWIVQAGYRQEECPDCQRTDPVTKANIEGLTRLRVIHWDLDFNLLIDGPHNIQLHWRHEFRHKDVGAEIEDDFAEGTMYASWNWSPHWSFTLQFEYLNDQASWERGNKFFAGIIQYRFSQSNFVRLFVGSQKGGLRCTGGVCRVFPEFEGVKLEATIRM